MKYRLKHWLAVCAVAVASAASAVVPAVAAHAASRTTSSTGYDISWPQCPSNYPSGGAFGIVGVNDGIAWSQNPCLGAEFSWAASRPGAPALYMNTADPGPQSTHWNLGGPQATSCDPSITDTTSPAFAACAYDYGWNTAKDALGVESSPVPSPSTYSWWLDVETSNTWAGSAAANADDIQGSIDYLHSVGVATVGVYSTSYQWQTITGGYAFPSFTPEWVAGSSAAHQAQSACSQTPFGGFNSSLALSQYHSGGFDADVKC
jgi:hypothetical protein